MPVFGDLYGMADRVREYDPRLTLVYRGRGVWRVLYDGAGVMRWDAGRMGGPPDGRLIMWLSRADAMNTASHRMLQEVEEREEARLESSRRDFEDKVGYAARERWKYHVRDLDGMPDHRTSWTFDGFREVG